MTPITNPFILGDMLMTLIQRQFANLGESGVVPIVDTGTLWALLPWIA